MKRPTHSDNRRQIIDSTIKLLHKTGFEKVSVRAICQNAGISIGTFYHSFRDKDDLLHAVLGGIDEYLLDEIQPRLTCDSQLENLRAFVLSGKTTRVWPSGLTRFSRQPDSFVVNSSQGGGFKDTWVLSH